VRRFALHFAGLIVLGLLVLVITEKTDLTIAADAYTWERVPGIADGPVVFSLAASPDGRVVFAGTEGNGVFRSNGGNAFVPRNNGLPTDPIPRISALAVAPNFNNTTLALLGTNGSGVYRTTNGGETWIPVSDIPSDAAVYSLAFAPDGASAFAAVGSATGSGIFLSRDGGSTWHPASLQPVNHLIWQLAVSPKYATDHTVFAGGGTTTFITTTKSLLWKSTDHSSQTTVAGGIFKSTDRGETWNMVFDRGTNGVSALLMVGDAVYAGTPDGGVFRSTDGGATWSPFENAGYHPTGIHSLAATTQYGSDAAIFAGTWVSGVFRTLSNSPSWSPINSSFPHDDAGYAAVQALVAVLGPDRIYAGTGGRAGADGQGVWSTSMPLQTIRIYLPITYKNTAGR